MIDDSENSWISDGLPSSSRRRRRGGGRWEVRECVLAHVREKHARQKHEHARHAHSPAENCRISRRCPAQSPFDPVVCALGSHAPGKKKIQMSLYRGLQERSVY